MLFEWYLEAPKQTDRQTNKTRSQEIHRVLFFPPFLHIFHTMSLSQESTQTALIAHFTTGVCQVGSAMFPLGEIAFFDSLVNLVFYDTNGTATSILSAEYASFLSFKIVKTARLFRMRLPTEAVIPWVVHNGFPAESSQLDYFTISIALDEESFAFFLGQTAPFLAASHARARSASHMTAMPEPFPVDLNAIRSNCGQQQNYRTGVADEALRRSEPPCTSFMAVDIPIHPTVEDKIIQSVGGLNEFSEIADVQVHVQAPSSHTLAQTESHRSVSVESAGKGISEISLPAQVESMMQSQQSPTCPALRRPVLSRSSHKAQSKSRVDVTHCKQVEMPDQDTEESKEGAGAHPAQKGKFFSEKTKTCNRGCRHRSCAYDDEDNTTIAVILKKSKEETARFSSVGVARDDIEAMNNADGFRQKSCSLATANESVADTLTKSVDPKVLPVDLAQTSNVGCEIFDFEIDNIFGKELSLVGQSKQQAPNERASKQQKSREKLPKARPKVSKSVIQNSSKRSRSDVLDTKAATRIVSSSVTGSILAVSTKRSRAEDKCPKTTTTAFETDSEATDDALEKLSSSSCGDGAFLSSARAQSEVNLKDALEGLCPGAAFEKTARSRRSESLFVSNSKGADKIQGTIGSEDEPNTQGELRAMLAEGLPDDSLDAFLEKAHQFVKRKKSEKRARAHTLGPAEVCQAAFDLVNAYCEKGRSQRSDFFEAQQKRMRALASHVESLQHHKKRMVEVVNESISNISDAIDAVAACASRIADRQEHNRAIWDVADIEDRDAILGALTRRIAQQEELLKRLLA